MSQKFALVIGNNQHDDPDWHDLKTPELDAEAMTAVLEDAKIDGFDRVVTLLNASVQQMREAIAELFDANSHKPDDLLLYFSGHGELDPGNSLYHAELLEKAEVITIAPMFHNLTIGNAENIDSRQSGLLTRWGDAKKFAGLSAATGEAHHRFISFDNHILN